MAVGGDGKEIAEGWRDERGELLFGEELEEGGFVVIEGALKSRHKLHFGASGGGVQKSLKEWWLNWGMEKCNGICGPVVHTRLMMLPRLVVQFPKRTRLVDAFLNDALFVT